MAKRIAANIAWVRNQLGPDAQKHPAEEILSAMNEAQREIGLRVGPTRSQKYGSEWDMTADAVALAPPEGGERLVKLFGFNWLANDSSFPYPVTIASTREEFASLRDAMGDVDRGQPEIVFPYVNGDGVVVADVHPHAAITLLENTYKIDGLWAPADMVDDPTLDPTIPPEWDFVLRYGALYFLTGSPDWKARYDERMNTVIGTIQNPIGGKIKVSHSSDKLGF